MSHAPGYLTPELAAFFKAVAPAQSLLPTPDTACTGSGAGKPSAVQPMPYQIHSNDVHHVAELRIRHWIVQQEQEARRQQHQRLFGNPKT